MLEGRILGLDLGLSYGSGSLKALQNDNLPEIDLLVREAIQNSSDASLRETGESFGVNFNYSTFSPCEFNSMLGEVGSILDKRFPEEQADYLEIRDFYTSGLTGETRTKDVAKTPEDHGNYFKLVFDTGKEQTNSDDGMAGGSWGYGKSVYFRFGIGLVVFYSRIKNDAGYESRLILSLIENENSKEAILRQVKSDAVGRAWWGIVSANDVLPLTDESEIKEVLDIFGVKEYTGSDTGTSIIIPYIDKAKLLDGIFPENCGINDDIIKMCSFKDDIVEYTKLAIQKWYAPKIFNKNLSKYSSQKWLAVRVNGVPLRTNEMRPLFKLVQELYTSALSANNKSVPPYVSPLFSGIKTVSVPSSKIEGEKAGNVATIVVKNSDLGSTGSIIPPQAYLRLFGAMSPNDPITMFARAAGMVLDYKIEGRWTKRLIKPENDDEMLFSFFVPDCSLKLKKSDALKQYSGISLGDYLRKCEKSDHMSWTDPASLTVVTNMAERMTSKVNDCYKVKTPADLEGTASRLSGKLGKRLLPTVGFGKKKPGPGGGGSGSGGALDNLECVFTGYRIGNGLLDIDFELKFKNIRKKAFIGVFVESETGLLDAKKWKEDIGTQYPLDIVTLKNCSVYARNSDHHLSFVSDCTRGRRMIENDYSRIQLQYYEEADVMGFRVENTITNAVVSGTIELRSDDKKYCCTVKETKEAEE